jgi:hypothetical protein
VNQNPNKLLVEGHDDLFSVAGLMRHYINWPNNRDEVPVWIEVGYGASNILEKDYISTLVKNSTTKVLGVMLDADLDANARYDSFRNLCIGLFPKMPKQLPSDGLIIDNDEGKRIGLWLMPDNISKGAIEVFLKFLVPDTSNKEWQHAVKATTDAKGLGCKYKDCHMDKANLYSWLAWQDEPGQSPGNALTRKILDPKAPTAKPFVKWFMNLYSLQPSNNVLS